VDPVVIAFGLGVGILIGLTGIGGGSLMTPLLILVVGTKPVVAIGTDLAYGAITKTLGGWRHLRKGTVDLGLTAWMASGSVPGSLIGVAVLDRLHDHYGKSFDNKILIGLAAALLLVAGAVLVRALFMPRLLAREVDSPVLDRPAKTQAALIGLVLGFILGMTSVGSGALIGLALILVFRLTPRRVVGTDVFHAAILLWVSGFGHFLAGNVDFGLMANILVGSLPGVWIGTGLITRVPQNGLRPTLGVVLLASALAIFNKAGIDVPVAVIIGAPAVVGVLAWLLHRTRQAQHLPAPAAATSVPPS